MVNDNVEIKSKQCKTCGEWYPATPEYFHREASVKSGLRPHCKECQNTRGRVKDKIRHEKKIANREPNHCLRCGKVIKHGSKRCSECVEIYKEEYKKQYYLDNRDQVLENVKAYYQDNIEARKVYSRQYHHANKEYANARSREWKRNNREYATKKNREWQRNNPDKVKARNDRWAAKNPDHKRTVVVRRRARKRNLPDNYTAQDWQYALDYFNGCCAVCGRPPGLWHTLAMDHWIALSSPDCPGTIPANIVPLCHPRKDAPMDINGYCNSSKHSMNAEQWLIEKYGNKKARVIIKRIKDYFASLE